MANEELAKYFEKLAAADVELCPTCHQPLPSSAKTAPGASTVRCSRCPATASFIVTDIAGARAPVALCRPCYVDWKRTVSKYVKGEPDA